MRQTVIAALAAALALASCAAPTGAPETTAIPDATTSTTTVDPPHPGATRALMAFDACDDLLDWTIGRALDRVGPYGLDGYGDFPVYATLESAGIAPTQAGDAIRKDTVVGTNLQVAGVDEPDLVKTDGNRIVTVAGSRLSVLTVDGDRITLEDSIDLGSWSQDLYLDGDRVIAIADGAFEVMPLREGAIGSPGMNPPIATPTVTVIEVDISNPGDIELTRTLRIDGRYVSSRMVDAAIRLVVSSGPTGFAWEYPDGGGLRAERLAEQKNREIIEHSTVENWLPYFILTDLTGRDHVVAEGTLLACDRTHRPEEFSGFTTLSLVTLDTDELAVVDATAVFADGDIVYSSNEATYVATTRWIDPIRFADGKRPEGTKTRIHKFSLTPSGADYEASGEVSGYLLSQWSMSEYDGYLRVASTDAPQWWDGPESDSRVTVLAERGGELDTVGVVDGLGRGERIYSVRFFDDRGYVVTFRQVDPLYVIDLSDPARPTVTGSLKIPGYSSYLHPVGDDLILGVGRDADLDGRTDGLQASLFDVSEATDPDRIDRLTMEGGHSEVEWDHHAFLFDRATGMTVIPYERWDGRTDGPPPSGALVLTVDEDGIRKEGVVTHAGSGREWWGPIRRSLLIGDTLVTISDGGVLLSDRDTLEPLDWAELG